MDGEGQISGAGRCVVLVGPAGAGKTTIAHRLIAAQPADRAFSVSHTSRPMRAGERDGVDYWFVARDAFEALIAADAFVEWARVHDNLYGTTRAAIAHHLQAGRQVIFDIDIEGAGNIARAFPDRTDLVFVSPPSWQVLVRRLRARGSESDDRLRRRLCTARAELEAVLRQADAGVAWTAVVNDDLDRAVADVEALLCSPPGAHRMPDAERARLRGMGADAAADVRADSTDPAA